MADKISTIDEEADEIVRRLKAPPKPKSIGLFDNWEEIRKIWSIILQNQRNVR